MHETAIIESVIDIIISKAQEVDLKKISRVTAKVGEMSGALPEALVFAFDSASKGTIAEGAEFIIDKINATAKCDPCGIVFNIDHFNKLCPECKSFCSNILTGYELYIDTIEGD